MDFTKRKILSYDDFAEALSKGELDKLAPYSPNGEEDENEPSADGSDELPVAGFGDDSIDSVPTEDDAESDTGLGGDTGIEAAYSDVEPDLDNGDGSEEDNEETSDDDEEVADDSEETSDDDSDESSEEDSDDDSEEEKEKDEEDVEEAATEDDLDAEEDGLEENDDAEKEFNFDDEEDTYVDESKLNKFNKFFGK